MEKYSLNSPKPPKKIAYGVPLPRPKSRKEPVVEPDPVQVIDTKTEVIEPHLTPPVDPRYPRVVAGDELQAYIQSELRKGNDYEYNEKKSGGRAKYSIKRTWSVSAIVAEPDKWTLIQTNEDTYLLQRNFDA